MTPDCECKVEYRGQHPECGTVVTIRVTTVTSSIDATMSMLQKRELTDAAVDFLSDEEHMDQDEQVLEYFDPALFEKFLDDVSHENHARNLRLLVREVSWCANSGGKKYMQESATEIAAVLQDSKIQHIVQQAWQEKKFRTIRMIREWSLRQSSENSFH